MARRRLVKTVVRELRKEHPDYVVQVLYSHEWGGRIVQDALPESEWGEYRVDGVRFFDTLIVVEAS